MMLPSELRVNAAEAKGVALALGLSEVAEARLRRLIERTPWIHAWPPISFLSGLLESKPPYACLTSAEFDAAIAFWQCLLSEEALDQAQFDSIMDVVLEKISKKGGTDCDLKQIPDIVYEGQVRLVLAAFRFQGVSFNAKELSKPDLVFTVAFHSGGESKVAIECKNIRSYSGGIRDWVRTTADAIKKAANQHKKRKDHFSDLVVFVDLPIEAFLMPTPPREYERLIVNVWRQLELEGWSDVDETHVVFTSTSQENMAAYMCQPRDKPVNLTMMRPLVVGKQEVRVSSAHAILLSWLFRDHDQSVNLGNWSERALYIADPENLYLD